MDFNEEIARRSKIIRDQLDQIEVVGQKAAEVVAGPGGPGEKPDGLADQYETLESFLERNRLPDGRVSLAKLDPDNPTFLDFFPEPGKSGQIQLYFDDPDAKIHTEALTIWRRRPGRPAGRPCYAPSGWFEHTTVPGSEPEHTRAVLDPSPVHYEGKPVAPYVIRLHRYIGPGAYIRSYDVGGSEPRVGEVKLEPPRKFVTLVPRFDLAALPTMSALMRPLTKEGDLYDALVTGRIRLGDFPQGWTHFKLHTNRVPWRAAPGLWQAIWQISLSQANPILRDDALAYHDCEVGMGVWHPDGFNIAEHRGIRLLEQLALCTGQKPFLQDIGTGEQQTAHGFTQLPESDWVVGGIWINGNAKHHRFGVRPKGRIIPAYLKDPGFHKPRT